MAYGPTLAVECLAEEDGLSVAVETLRQWLLIMKQQLRQLNIMACHLFFSSRLASSRPRRCVTHGEAAL